MSDELISCILATRNRPQFVEQALRCFEAQTYRNRELIVVDDGELNVRDLCLNRHGVRYVLIGGVGATLYGFPLRTGDTIMMVPSCPLYSGRRLWNEPNLGSGV